MRPPSSNGLRTRSTTFTQVDDEYLQGFSKRKSHLSHLAMEMPFMADDGLQHQIEKYICWLLNLPNLTLMHWWCYAMQVARQRDKAEEKLQLLYGRLNDAKRVGRKALAERTSENRFLITELTDTRRTARTLKAQLAIPIEHHLAAMGLRPNPPEVSLLGFAHVE